jgi:tetrahydromethanopterin S-methyltransferase subunit G
MADSYTREELEGQTRLALRRICKGKGMSSEDCAKMEFDDMVDWIMGEQDGGGKKAAPKKSATKKKAPSRGTKKTTTKGRSTKKSEPDPEDPEETGEVVDNDLLNAVMEKLSTLEEKIDTIGEITDKNTSQIVEDLGELRTDVYAIGRRQSHFYDWMVNDGNLSEDGAPEQLSFADLEAAIEEECSGNEDGE